MYTEYLEKWIARSITKHFYNALEDEDLFVQIEGAPDKKNDYSSWAEIRIDGPDVSELGPTYFRLDYVVDILVQTSSEQNIFAIAELIGKVRSLYTCIVVLNDSDVSVGYLDVDGVIETVNYGKIENHQHMRQALRANYVMHYEESE